MKTIAYVAILTMILAGSVPAGAVLCLRSMVYESRIANITAYYGQMDGGDMTGALGRFAKSATYRRDGVVYEGRTAIVAFYQRVRKLKGQHQVAELIDLPLTNSVVVEGIFVGTDDGVPVKIHFYDIWKFNGRGEVIYRSSQINNLDLD